MQQVSTQMKECRQLFINISYSISYNYDGTGDLVFSVIIINYITNSKY